MIRINKSWRKLDNTAKAFSVEGKKNVNTFRLSVILKEKVDLNILKEATKQAIEAYPSYRVKIKSGFFWNYLKINSNKTIVEEETGMPCKNIDFRKNNGYLFKVTYFNNKINLDVFHALTDGMGATIFLKEIVYNYLNIKYNLETNKVLLKDIGMQSDEYLKNVDRKLVYKEDFKKAFLIKEKSNLLKNKTYHYILDLEHFKNICRKHNVSITEYLTALYIFALYRSSYDKTSNKDLIVTIPIDLRRHYNVESFSNFFTCMNVEGNVVNKKHVTFSKLLKQVHNEFKEKLTLENIKKYLLRDVKLGTNIGIKLVPLFAKKTFMKYFEKIVNQKYTTTFTNIGPIKIEKKYKKYIENIMVLVNAGNIQKVKCSICSYENNLTVTLNSNLITNKVEKEFYKLLVEYIGNVKVLSNVF